MVFVMPTCAAVTSSWAFSIIICVRDSGIHNFHGTSSIYQSLSVRVRLNTSPFSIFRSGSLSLLYFPRVLFIPGFQIHLSRSRISRHSLLFPLPPLSATAYRPPHYLYICGVRFRSHTLAIAETI